MDHYYIVPPRESCRIVAHCYDPPPPPSFPISPRAGTPRRSSASRSVTQVGSDLEVDKACEAARLVAVNLITTMKGKPDQHDGAKRFLFACRRRPDPLPSLRYTGTHSGAIGFSERPRLGVATHQKRAPIEARVHQTLRARVFAASLARGIHSLLGNPGFLRWGTGGRLF